MAPTKKKAKAIAPPVAEPEASRERDEGQHNLSREQQPRPKSQKNLDLTQKVARLLSQEPTATAISHPIPFQPITNLPVSNHAFNPSDISSQISSLVDQKVKILNEKLKLYQSQITQLRNELEAKNQIIEEFRKFQQSEAEKTVEKYKSIAEAKFSANAKLINAQASELKENRTLIKDLNEKISRIYSGEEEQDRIRLEAENQELLKLNEQLKANADNQRRKRKELERELGRANAMAQEAEKERLKEATDEVETLKKMLEAETTNSKGLISQLNQLRSNNNNSTTSSNTQRNNHNNNQSNSSSNHSNEVIEDLKTRASIVGDFTGFTILNSSTDTKGPIYDCMVTDLVARGFDPERDDSTIKVIPDFLREFIRFQKEATGHLYWKLFQAFNL